MGGTSRMIEIAVVGCGVWGRNHIRVLSSLRGAKVDKAVDPSLTALGWVREFFPGIACEQDVDSILNDPAIEAVVIATPTRSHYDLTRRALAAGKHVLCEKPLCQTAKEARELVDLAATGGLRLMVGHIFLFNAGLQKVKQLLDAGEIGRVYYLSAVRTNLGPIRDDVNASYDLAAHDVSIFNWLLGGPPEAVSATGASFLQPGIEDVAFISLRYPRDIFANIHASWLNPKKVRQITVVGSRTMVTWDDLELNTPVTIYDKGANPEHEYSEYGEFLRLSMWDGDVRQPKVNLGEPLRAEDRHFLDRIRNDGDLQSDGVFSLDVVRVLEAAELSLKQGGLAITL